MLKDSVELRVATEGGLMPEGRVTCEVTHPSGTTYRATTTPSVARSHFGAVDVLAGRVAMFRYPTDFHHAPDRLDAGEYQVLCEVSRPTPLAIWGPVKVDGSFCV